MADEIINGLIQRQVEEAMAKRADEYNKMDKKICEEFEKLNAKAVAAERERCAQKAQSYITLNSGDLTLAKLCAAAIRKGE